MTRDARLAKGSPRIRLTLRPQVERLEERTLLSFSPPTYFTTGQGPWYLITEDLNGDKVLDLVTANLEGNSVSVLLGRGDGTFAPARSFAVGTRPYQVRAGHFNDDGFLDLLSANDGSSNLSLLLGNGDGTFRAAIHTPTDGEARGLAVGDFNQDGFADAVVAASFDRVAVHLSNGDGTFRPRVNYPPPSNPQAVVVGDFDKDGHLDFVVASLYTASVRRYLGNGDGTFQPGTSYAASMSNLYLHAADFNDDGFLDVATDARSNGVLSLQLNDGKGGLPIARSVQVGGESYGIASGDFDEDGRRDLVTTNVGRNTVSIARGNGDGTFQAPSTVTVGALDFTRPNAVAVGDFNGDGSADFAVVNQRTHQVAVLLNRPNATRISVTTSANPVAGTAFTITVRALDEGGTVASNYRGTVQFSSTDKNASLPDAYTFTPQDRGVKTFTVTLRQSGTQKIVARDRDTGTIAGEITLAVSAAAAELLMVTGFPAPVTAGVAGTVRVAAVDAFGNTATSYRGTVRFTSNDNQAVLPGLYTFQFGDNGVRMFNATLRTTGTRSLTVADVNTGSISGTQAEILVNPAAVSELRIGIAATATPGRPVGLTIEARDPFGNRGTQYRGTIRFTTSDARATLPADYTFTAGNAGFARFTSLILRTAGNQTFTVRDVVNNLTSNVTVAVVIPPVYDTPVHLNVGATPRSVAIADFNGDGQNDVATANYGGNSVSVLLGLGDGTFLNAVNYLAGRLTHWVGTGDFNGDGTLDLVTADFGDGTVSVLLGNGDGTFQPRANFPAGPSTVGGTLADLNGDGTLDLAVANYSAQHVSVLWGDGKGRFQPPVFYPVGAVVEDVTLGDINNDGNLDLITANTNRSASVLLGNGDGTFRPAVQHSLGGGEARSVVAGDLNGDGNLDLVTANQDSRDVSVLLGRGNNTFLTSVQYAVNGETRVVHLSDVDGDGVLDIITANFTGGASVLIGFGDGRFQNALSYATGSGPLGLGVGDLNGDGAPDLAVANGNSHTISVLLNQTPPVRFAIDAPASRISGSPFTITMAAVNAFGGPAVGYRGTVHFSSSDFDATLPADYTFTAADAGVRQFTVTLRRLGNQRIEVRDTVTSALVGMVTVNVFTRSLFYPAVEYSTGRSPRATAVSDVNGDGILDVVTASQPISVLLGRGDGTFLPAISYSTENEPHDVAVGDLNNDGFADLVLANIYSGSLSVLFGNGDGTFRSPVTLVAGPSPSSVRIADFNDDGNLDLALSHFWGVSADILLGNGDGTFRPPFRTPIDSQGSYYNVPGDFNGDGHMDLAVVHYFLGILVFLGNGDGTLQPGVRYATGGGSYVPAVGDFDHDGFVDLAVCNYTGNSVSVLLNNRDGTFRAAIHYATGAGTLWVAVEDFNGDGIPDLVTANRFADNASVLLGNGDGTFQAALNFRTGSAPASVAVGDFDLNGFPDIVVANGGGLNVSVLLNATGRFGSPGAPGSGSHGFADLLLERPRKSTDVDLTQQRPRSSPLLLIAAHVSLVFAQAQEEPSLLFRKQRVSADTDVEMLLEAALASPLG